METNILEEFLVVCEEGTLSKAAEKLHTTQPSLSRNIQKLEYEIGYPLFDKKKNRITLNENGTIAASYARMILNDIVRMKEDIRLNENRKHRIAFAASAPIPFDRITERLSVLYHEKTLSGTMSDEEDLIEGLQSGRYQLIVSSKRYDDPDLCTTLFMGEKLYLSVPEGDPFAKKKSVEFKEINGRAFLLNRTIGVWYTLVAENLPDSSFLVQYDKESLRTIAANSSLPAFTTDLSMKINGIHEGHTVIPFRDKEASMHFYLICRKENKDMFRDLFQEK